MTTEAREPEATDEFSPFTTCPSCGHVLAAHLDSDGRARPCSVYDLDDRTSAPRYKFCACRRMLNMEGKP